ncbi:signal peptidase I [Neobacillus notoginsengisoli]|uniref:signal peptidase I n=1 Tax=Neobacillus notoginsengisoli TaxID=1578198 RepID=UPI0023D91234|nr:signal peptidase I [Neobacillus notoginsengisoli]
MAKAKKELLSWGKSFFFALIIALAVRTFLFSPYIVEGSSMEPTLHNQEKIFVNKMGDFKRGDIVVIKGPVENYVKRVIALPGDTIEMKNDQLLINGKKIKEPYLTGNLTLAKQFGSKLTGDFGSFIVPKGDLFVMGDNRLHSTDTRNGLGFIKKSSIVGKSEFVFFPFSDIRTIK